MDTESPVLINTGSGYTLKYKGKYLYSSIQPESLVNKRVERLALREKTLVFIPSLGLGYGLKALLEKLPSSSHIIVVEADQILFHFTSNQKEVLIPSHENVTIVRTESVPDLINLVAKLGFWKFRKVIMCILSGGFHFYKQLYEEMFHFLEKEIQQYWKNKMTFIHMAPLWIRNIFSNLSIMHDSQDSFTLKTDMPVVVAGAGPSLEESIAIIKEVRKKVILLVVDTAFPFFYQLWEHGEDLLLPDFVFILESQIVNLKDFVSCKNPGVPCICDITSHPGVIRLFNKKYLFASRFADIRLFDRLENSGLLPMEFPALGSVGVAALYAALQFTSGPIFVTGLDFGYSEHMTHCKGTAHYHYYESSSARLTTLESLVYSAIAARPLVRQKGKQDKIVLTDLILSAYARQVPGIVGDRGGVYDIGKHGLDLGLPGVNVEKVSSIVGGEEKFEQPVFKNTTGRLTSLNQGNAMDFIIKEQEYLHECKKIITPLVKEHTREKTDFSRKEHEALVDVDYSYLHFPDQTDLPVYEPNFLFRVLISLEHYEKVLKRALHQFS